MAKKSLMAAQRLKMPARIILGSTFMITSIFHFTASDVQLQLIPPFLPWRRAALYITGILEFLGGLGLLLPHYQRPAGQGLALLLIAIFPANIYHTIKRKHFHGLTGTPLYHIVRWPMQVLLVWLALWCSNSKEKG